MGYTPTTWTTGDTITATAMNKIEQGIAGGGYNGPVVAVLYSVDSSTVLADGDFDAALEALSSGKPIVVWWFTSDMGHWSTTDPLMPYYDSNEPNKIYLYVNSTAGFIWTADGVEWFD